MDNGGIKQFPVPTFKGEKYLLLESAFLFKPVSKASQP
jgi:hypothetical protein